MDVLWCMGLVVLVVIAKNVAIVKNSGKFKWPLIILIPAVCAAFVINTLFLLTLPLFAVYRETIKQYLKIKHGENFTELIQGFDALYVCNSNRNSRVCTLLMFECKEDIYETIKTFVDDNFIKNSKILRKFHSTLRNCGGYKYLLKQTVSTDDCVKKMDLVICNENEITATDLEVLLSKCYNRPFSNNDSVLWDVFVGVQSVKRKCSGQNNLKHYPVLFRCHHCIADGVCFINFLAGVLSDEKPDVTAQDVIKSMNNNSFVVTIVKYIERCFNVFAFGTAVLIENMIQEKDFSILHGSTLSNKEVVAVKVDEFGEVLKKIKLIKRNTGSSFSQVLFTVFSAALRDYFEKRSSSYPEYITLVVPFSEEALLLPKIPLGRINVTDINFSNNFEMLIYRLPVFIKTESGCYANHSLTEKIEFIKKQSNNFHSLHLNKVLGFWIHIGLPVFPVGIATVCHKMLECTSIFSTLPGTPKLSLANGKLLVEELIFLAPHINEIGFNISITTYDNHLQIAVNADKTLISNSQEANGILDDVFKYIQLLEEEVK